MEKEQFPAGLDVLLTAESDHFLPAADPLASASSFSPVYDYLNAPLADLSLPFQYTLDSPQRCSLASLAGYLGQKGFSYAIADNLFRNNAEEERFKRLLALHPGVVGISTSSLHRLESVARIAGTIRRLSPASIIALGGCGLHFNPGMAAYADVVVAGDGELALGEIAAVAKSGCKAADLPRTLSPAGRLLDGVLHIEGRRDLSLKYLPAWTAYQNRGSACFPVETSRGCRYSCVFCSYPERGGQSYRPVESVINEIRGLTDGLGAKYLRFVDTNLTSDAAYVAELCGRLAQERLTIPWSCFARADELAVNADMCKRMAAAGCFWVYSGVESADEDILSRMGKGFGPREIEKGIKNVKAAGMAFHGNFVIGFPGETEATIERAHDMMTGSGMDTVSLTVLGITTAMAALAEKEPVKFAHLSRHGHQWKHSTMDFDSARGAAAALVRRIAMETGAPRIVSHGIAMYYLLGGGIDFAGVMNYFSAIRDYHRAKTSGNTVVLKASAEIIRGTYSKTAVNFGWPRPA